MRGQSAPSGRIKRPEASGRSKSPAAILPLTPFRGFQRLHSPYGFAVSRLAIHRQALGLQLCSAQSLPHCRFVFSLVFFCLAQKEDEISGISVHWKIIIDWDASEMYCDPI